MSQSNNIIKQTLLASLVWLGVGWAMYESVNDLSTNHLNSSTRILFIGFVILVPLVLIFKAITGKDINVTTPSTREATAERKMIRFSQLIIRNRVSIILAFSVVGFIFGYVAYLLKR